MGYLREEFPILENAVYLDVAHKASVPNPVLEAINQFYVGVHHNGGDKAVWHAKVREVRKKVAALLNADPAEIAFIKNASEALNFFANGLDCGAGENIVICDQEHENNMFPWMNLQKRGVEVRQVPSTAFYFGLEAIEKIVDHRTRAVSVSHICSASGFRPPIDQIGRFCRNRGIYLFLDAIQSVGAVDIDVKNLPVDAMATSAHKWLLGPYGIGFLYCRQDLIQKLTSVFAAKLYTAEHPQMLNTAL